MYTFPEFDIFEIAKQRSQERALMTSPEWNFVADIGASCFLERPDRAAWIWADDGNVYLDDKMSPEPGPYDSAKTPWAREWQELPLRYDVREAYCMKSSRVGWTEAMFNIVRWMPLFWPGNCGIVYPDDKLGRDVMKRRVADSVTAIAVNQMTDDPNDKTLSQITLKNMVIKCGPSGAARMFVEWWVRFFLLDEIEEHDQSDTTTTVDRALSRQSDVSDALLFAGSKPKKAGGPIDKNYIRGTQKKYELPCPRCERRIELLRSHFSYDECRQTNGTWDLDLVEKETRYRCQHCQNIIEEKEKFGMNQEGIWIPTPLASRRRGTDGKYVPPEPHVESYQISDYYSHHQELTWGKLMRRYLMAFEVAPEEAKKTHFINNHEGNPDEPKLIQIDVASIRALVAGIVEEREIKASDGTSIKVNLTIGMPGGFKLAYRHGQIQSALPFRPVLLLIFIDKQNTFLKYTVFGVVENGEAMLIDLGQVDDEDELYYIMLTRPYFSEGHTDPMYITAGFFDSRYRPHDVYKFCLKAYYQKGVNIWPVRGEGQRQDQNNSKTESQYRGKTFRLMEDQCELGKLFVRYFKDAALKAELYLNLIQKRAGPRIWLPNDYPETLASELTAERWDEEQQMFIHDKVKHGPNDYGDCFKYLTLWRMENLVQFLANHSPTPDLPEPRPVREYTLHPREGPTAQAEARRQ